MRFDFLNGISSKLEIEISKELDREFIITHVFKPVSEQINYAIGVNAIELHESALNVIETLINGHITDKLEFVQLKVLCDFLFQIFDIYS